MEFLLQHREAIITLISTIAIAFLPPVNRFLDRVTSKRITKDIFWFLDKLEDGTLTKEEAQQIIAKLKNYLKSDSQLARDSDDEPE